MWLLTVGVVLGCSWGMKLSFTLHTEWPSNRNPQLFKTHQMIMFHEPWMYIYSVNFNEPNVRKMLAFIGCLFFIRLTFTSCWDRFGSMALFIFIFISWICRFFSWIIFLINCQKIPVIVLQSPRLQIACFIGPSVQNPKMFSLLSHVDFLKNDSKLNCWDVDEIGPGL